MKKKSPSTSKKTSSPVKRAAKKSPPATPKRPVVSTEAGDDFIQPGAEDKAGLESVMASLSNILGGKDFLSDAELDALLDSKMASGEIPPSMGLDPLDEAQSLIYEAWNTEGPERAKLARRALELSRDCADAYIILAEEEANSAQAAHDLYRDAVDAATRVLPPELFKNAAGNFWLMMETRPYMRARLGLAEALWDLHKQQEALGHLREMLRLNPSDNQGVRYLLIQWLLESGDDEELGQWLGRYADDDSPGLRYAHALWLFRRAGPGKSANAQAAKAIRANPHVVDFLLGRKEAEGFAEESVSPGSPEEAASYALGGQAAWTETRGALDWLRTQSPK